MEEQDHRICEEQLNYRFNDRGLLELALTHSSAKTPGRESNERLEFLGDAVLGMIISEELYERFEDADEGRLTKAKSWVVRGTTLRQATEPLGILPFVRVGKGIRVKKERPPSLAGNVFEAIVAAIYLDGGFDAAKTFVLAQLSEQIVRVEDDRHTKNYKSLLQQRVQRESGEVPTYEVIAEKGPDHDKRFEVVAIVAGVPKGRSWGNSKKDAEQEAARLALRSVHFAAKAIDRRDPDLEEAGS